jgi:hypothetical protein
MITELPTPTHAERLAAAAATTAAARSHVDDHAALAATVHRLQAAAVAGELDDTGAADLVKQSEALRISEIVLPRKQAVLRDALAAEYTVAAEVLESLALALDPLAKDAAAAADLLTAAMIHPAAAELRGDTGQGYHRDTGRTILEGYAHGVYPASMLAERIETARRTNFGAAHVPAAAREILASWEAEVQGIKAGTAALKAALRAVEKISAS